MAAMNPPIRILVRVIGVLSPGYVRVIVGPGLGMMDGGREQDYPAELIPSDLRVPNAEFFVTDFSESGFKIERVSGSNH
jgi:hypothetical protein